MPSENVAFAVNCCCNPNGRLTSIGFTTIDVAVAEVTVSVALPETPPRAAVIVTEPLANAFVLPAVGNVLLMVATDVSEELHWTVLVTSCVLLSLYVPVAVNC